MSFCTKSSKKIVVPMTNKSFYSDPSRVKSETDAIKTKWGYIVNPVSQLVGLPAEVIFAFIKIESEGKADAVGGISLGLMQINPLTGSTAFFTDLNQKRLTNGELSYLKLGIQKAGGNPNKVDLRNLKKDANGKYILNPSLFTRKELLQPEVNVLLGSIFAKQLIDTTHDADNTARLDKVITIYNTGFKTQQMAKKFTGTTDQLMAKVPSITQAYIKKFVIKNGIIDSITTQGVLII